MKTRRKQFGGKSESSQHKLSTVVSPFRHIYTAKNDRSKETSYNTNLFKNTYKDLVDNRKRGRSEENSYNSNLFKKHEYAVEINSHKDLIDNRKRDRSEENSDNPNKTKRIVRATERATMRKTAVEKAEEAERKRVAFEQKKAEREHKRAEEAERKRIATELKQMKHEEAAERTRVEKERKATIRAQKQPLIDARKEKEALTLWRKEQKTLGRFQQQTIPNYSPAQHDSFLLPNHKNMNKSENVSLTPINNVAVAGTRKANAFYAKIRKTMRKFKDAYKHEYATASCNRTGAIELKSQQKFVKEFVNNYTPFTGLVLWHGLGSGKTLSAISITEQIIADVIRRQSKNNMYKKKHIIICAPAMLESNFNTELIKYEKGYKPQHPRRIPIDEYYAMYSANGKLTMASHNQNFARLINNSVIIIDESQLYINAVSKKLFELEKQKNRTKPTTTVKKPINESIVNNYNAMMNDPTCRVVCLSGTPIVNSADEIAVLMNLLAKCPPMYVFENIDDSLTGRVKLSELTLPYLTSIYGKNPIFACIDFSRSELDLKHDKIRIVQNPVNFINKHTNTVYFDANENTFSGDEFLQELTKVFGPNTEVSNTAPIFDLLKFNEDYGIENPEQYPLYDIATDIKGTTRVSKRTATIKNVDEFRAKCAGFVSFFGNMDSLLPTTIVNPNAGLPSHPLLKVGLALNGSPLFTIQRCEYTQSMQSFVEQDLKALLVNSGLEFMAFMSAARTRFIYPFVDLSKVSEILKNMALFFDMKIEEYFNSKMSSLTGDVSSIQTPFHLKYYMKYITLILRPKKVYNPDTKKNVVSLDIDDVIRDSLHKNSQIHAKTILKWKGTDKETQVSSFVSLLLNTSLNNETGSAANIMSKTNLLAAKTAYDDIVMETLSRVKAFRACWYHPSDPHNHPLAISLGNNQNVVYLDDLNNDTRFAMSDVQFLHDAQINRGQLLSMCSPKLPYLNDIIVNAVEKNKDEKHKNKKMLIYSQYKQTSIPLTRVLFNPDEFEELEIGFEKDKNDGTVKVKIINDLAKTAHKRRYMFITGSGNPEDVDESLDENLFNSFLVKGKNEGNTEKMKKQHLINIFNGDIHDNEYSFVSKQIKEHLDPIHANVCDIVILNSAAAEGITLKQIRHAVLYHLPSDMSKIYQIIGRAVRNCTHSNLDADQQNVEPLLFLNTNVSGNNYLTNDEIMYNKYVNTSEEFAPYLNALREASIDCKMNSLIEKSDGSLLYPGLSQKCLIK